MKCIISKSLAMDIKNALEKTRAKGQPINTGLSNDSNITHESEFVKLKDVQDVNDKLGYTATLRKDLKETLKPYFVKEIKNKKTGITAHISGNSVDKMGSKKAIEKSKDNGFTVDEHFEIARNVIELFNNADLVSSKQDKNGSKNIISVKRFSCETKTKSGKPANAYITVKESVQHGHKIYSLEAIKINKAPEETGALGQEAKTRLDLTTPRNITHESEFVKLKDVQDVNDKLGIKKSLFSEQVYQILKLQESA